MADSSSNDDSNSAGSSAPALDPNDPNQGWDYNWLNPYGDFTESLPDLMPGPLMENPPPSYFPGNGGGRPSDHWAAAVDAAMNDAAARAHEFDLPYTPAGSLLAGDLSHADAVPPPQAPVGSFVPGDPNASFSAAQAGGNGNNNPSTDAVTRTRLTPAPVPPGSFTAGDPVYSTPDTLPVPSHPESNAFGMVAPLPLYGADIPDQSVSADKMWMMPITTRPGEDIGIVSGLSNYYGLSPDHFAKDAEGKFIYWDGRRWVRTFLSGDQQMGDFLDHPSLENFGNFIKGMAKDAADLLSEKEYQIEKNGSPPF